MHDAQPDSVDVRENRAVVNAARLRAGVPVDVDTPADVLRLAVALCGGDVSLVTPSRLRGLPRGQRRALLAALDEVIGDNPAKLADVRRHQEPFKRLGERLHPHEHPRRPAAQDAFAVARGELEARSLAGRCDLALAEGDPGRAIEILSNAPGMLLRAVDRLARSGADPARLAEAVRQAAPAASTRVLLSLREHLLNRDAPAAARMFVNQRGRPWVGADERPPLDAEMAAALAETLDAEVAARLPRIERLVVDPAARSVAVPLSGKARMDGLGILPRGSTMPAHDHVRFFVYWKQREHRTDYDLSVSLLDERFELAGQVSWTNLEDGGAVHSGDLTEAPAGASEFIDIDLASLSARYVRARASIAPRRRSSATCSARRARRGGRSSRAPCAPSPTSTGRAAPRCRCCSRVTTPGPGPARLEPGEPVTFLGLDYPDDLPPGSTAYTPVNLTELLSSA